jgi:predicted permease
MLTIALSALLPAAVTLFVGYIAAWHHDLDSAQAAILNRMVMSCALPLILGLSVASLREVVLVMALPAAAVPVIFAVRFQTAQQEMASTLFLCQHRRHPDPRRIHLAHKRRQFG